MRSKKPTFEETKNNLIKTFNEYVEAVSNIRVCCCRDSDEEDTYREAIRDNPKKVQELMELLKNL